MRRYLYLLHLWIGISLGAYFSLMGLTGSTLVFKTEIETALAPDLYRVSVPHNPTRQPLDGLISAFRQSHPGVTAFSVQLPQENDASIVFKYIPATPANWRGPTINPFSPVEPLASQGRHDRHELFVDPYTGATLGEHLVGGTFFYLVHNLHAHLLLEGYGYTFHTYAVLVLAALVASGLWLWWPSSKHFRKQLKARTRIKFSANIKRIVVDLHHAAGFYAFAVLFTIVVTASLHFWPGPAEALFSAIATMTRRAPQPSQGASLAPPVTCGQPGSNTSQASPYADMYRRAHLALPALSVLQFDIDPENTVVSLGSRSDHLVAPRLTTVTFCTVGGQVERMDTPASTAVDARLDAWVMFVHFGQWGRGLLYYVVKSIWFAVGFCPLTLFVSGVMMYLNKRRARMAQTRGAVRSSFQ
jgi:uncharacterized iron-regulated membrane protein